MFKLFLVLVLLAAAAPRTPSLSNLTSTSGKVACESRCSGEDEMSIESCVAECTSIPCFKAVFTDGQSSDEEKRRRDFKQCVLKEVSLKFKELRRIEL